MSIAAPLVKKLGRRCLHRLGYELVRCKLQSKGKAYGPVLPAQTYSPWLLDEEFLKAYKAIAGFTLVDIYRCWELWSLTEQAAKVPGSIIEVGAWRGGTGALIGLKAHRCGISDPVYLCDTFRGVVKTGPHDPFYKGGEHADTSPDVVQTLVHGRLKLENVRILEGAFPEETGHMVGDHRFRMCHVDVDVYESARDVVEWINPRMSMGGICIFDDYGFEGTPGVTKLVDEQRSLGDRVVIHNLNGHAVIVRTA